MVPDLLAVRYMGEGSGAMRLPATVLLGVVLLLVAFSTLSAKPESKARIADQFTVRWSSVQYNTSVALYNSEVSPGKTHTSENLSLACEIAIGDPNLILGSSGDGVITQLTDSRGLKLEVAPVLRRSRSWQSYEGLRYDRRFTRPPEVPRWKRLLRSALKLQVSTNFTPQLVDELQPSRLELRLDKQMLKQGVTEIGRLEGYFYALVAESLLHLDLPFEPNDTWVPLTPEIEIQVRDAYCNGTEYGLQIEVNPGGRASLRSLGPGVALPQQLVVDRKLLGPDGKPIPNGNPFRHLPMHVGGRQSGRGPNMSISAIRYVIAVHPTHQKIPFVLEHVPLPQVQP